MVCHLAIGRQLSGKKQEEQVAHTTYLLPKVFLPLLFNKHPRCSGTQGARWRSFDPARQDRFVTRLAGMLEDPQCTQEIRKIWVGYAAPVPLLTAAVIVVVTELQAYQLCHACFQCPDQLEAGARSFSGVPCMTAQHTLHNIFSIERSTMGYGCAFIPHRKSFLVLCIALICEEVFALYAHHIAQSSCCVAIERTSPICRIWEGSMEFDQLWPEFSQILLEVALHSAIHFSTAVLFH